MIDVAGATAMIAVDQDPAVGRHMAASVAAPHTAIGVVDHRATTAVARQDAMIVVGVMVHRDETIEADLTVADLIEAMEAEGANP